jgi:hypothetical protein
MKKIVIIIFLLSFISSYSQSGPIKNFRILDSLIQKQSILFAEIIKTKNINKIRLNFSENPASWLVKQHFYSAFTEKKIEVNYESDTGNPILNVNIKTIAIDYLLYNQDNDSLIRNATVDIDANLSSSGNIEIISNGKSLFKDIISREDINFIKSDNEFANAPVPQKKKTFFEEIAIPFVVVTTAILTVVILFTVRSG